MKENKRMCIYTKDIMRITGKGERYCRRLLKSIRDKLGKNRNDFVSVEEFCNTTGLNEEQVKSYLIG